MDCRASNESMRLLLTVPVLFFITLAGAQAQGVKIPAPAVTPPAATARANPAAGAAATPAAVPTTAPTIGVIDFYGLNKITEDRIRKTLGFKEGDPFPRSKANVEESLDKIPGVVESHLE